MGVATGFTFPSDGDTSNATNDLVNNFNILKDSVNNVVADQITDATITNVEIASSGILAAKVKGLATTEEDLTDFMLGYIRGCYLSRNSDTELSVSAGSIVGPNGEWRRTTSALTNSPSMTNSTWNDVYADFDAAASTFVLEVLTNQATPGASTATATSSRLIGSIFTDATGDLNQYINLRKDEVVGWSWILGDSTAAIEETITFGVTFDSAPIVQVSLLGERETTDPADIGELNAVSDRVIRISTNDITTTTMQPSFRAEAGFSMASSSRYGYAWVARGSYT